MNYEIVADYQCSLGEGPLWHPREKLLYWVDILRGRLFMLDPETGTTRRLYEGGLIGGCTFVAGGGFLFFGERGTVRYFDGTDRESPVLAIEAERGTRFNDVLADPEGRVFAGTMPSEGRSAKLYRIDPDGTATLVDPDIGLSNGLAFSPDLSKLYYSDSGGEGFPPSIYVYDHDRATGAISNRQVFHASDSSDGTPDGMTVDHEGCIWSARWGPGCVIRIRPDGIEDYRVELPARKITSCVFGGPDLSDLYITSAGGDDRSLEENGPAAGALFRIRPGVHGFAEYEAAYPASFLGTPPATGRR